MLTITGEKYSCCTGVSRRSFLKAGVLGLAGLTLGDVLRLRAAQADYAALTEGAAGVLRVGIYQSVGTRILPTLLREFLERSIAQAAGPAIASMLIYVLMAVVLAIRPQGLFPVRQG